MNVQHASLSGFHRHATKKSGLLSAGALTAVLALLGISCSSVPESLDEGQSVSPLSVAATPPTSAGSMGAGAVGPDVGPGKSPTGPIAVAGTQGALTAPVTESPNIGVRPRPELSPRPEISAEPVDPLRPEAGVRVRLPDGGLMILEPPPPVVRMPDLGGTPPNQGGPARDGSPGYPTQPFSPTPPPLVGGGPNTLTPTENFYCTVQLSRTGTDSFPTLTIDVLANRDGTAWARVDWPSSPVGIVLDLTDNFDRIVIAAPSTKMPAVSVYRTGAALSGELGCQTSG